MHYVSSDLSVQLNALSALEEGLAACITIRVWWWRGERACFAHGETSHGIKMARSLQKNRYLLA